MQDQVLSALARLFARWLEKQGQAGGLPLCEAEPKWRSPCELGEPHAGQVTWRPHQRAEPESFAPLEGALAMTLHPAGQAFYGHWFCRPLPFWFKGLQLTLIQPWNEQDMDLLKENLIGHLLMQRRLGRSATLFLASCRDEMGQICLDNESGAVLYERLDSGRRTRLCPDLASFLDRLEP